MYQKRGAKYSIKIGFWAFEVPKNINNQKFQTLFLPSKTHKNIKTIKTISKQSDDFLKKTLIFATLLIKKTKQSEVARKL